MKNWQSLLVIIISLTGISIALTQDQKKPDLPAVTSKLITRVVQVSPELLEGFSQAQTRTADARKVLEESPAYLKYQRAVAEENTSLLYIAAESGIKPSQLNPVVDHQGNMTKSAECQPIYDQRSRRLIHFSCQETALAVKPVSPQK